MGKKTIITIYYDGDCPICHGFVHFIHVKHIYVLRLVDMRSNPSIVVEFDEKGINLDQGFVICHDNELLQGEEAFLYLDTIISSKKRLFHSVFHFIVKRKVLRKIAYRWAVCLRNILLVLQGRQPLHTKQSIMKDTCGMMKGKCGTCWSLTHIVFGLTIALMGLSKLIGGAAVMTGVGNMALGLVGASGSSEGLALVLGALVGVTELVGGISFMISCKYTSKIASHFLLVIMSVALLVHIFVGVGGPSGIAAFNQADGYDKIIAFLLAVRVPLLYVAVFADYSFRCCRARACCKDGACDVPVQI